MRPVYFLIGLLYSISHHELHANTSDYPALLGNGFDGLKLEHKSRQCVEGDSVELVNTSFYSSFTKVESWNSLQAQFNFNVPGSILLSPENGLVQFAMKAKSNDLSSTYISQNHVTVKQKILKNPKVTFIETDTKKFRDECGTQFVSTINTGGRLHVAIKFSFSNTEIKQDFDAGGSVKSITGLGAHISALAEDTRKNTRVEIFIHQTGGDLSELDNIFQSSDVITCSLEQFDKCENIMKGIYKYSLDHFAKSVIEKNAQTISFQLEDYPNFQRIYESSKIKKERAKIIESLDQHEYDENFLIHRKEEASLYVNCDERCFAKLLNKVASNKRVLIEAVKMSFENPDIFLESSILEKLDLYEIKIPELKKQTPYFFLTNYSYLLPMGAIGIIILPFFMKYFMQQKVYA